jgi:hypothetical protein
MQFDTELKFKGQKAALGATESSSGVLYMNKGTWIHVLKNKKEAIV